MIEQSRGFTLLELMTAVVILGIITAVALPNYREQSRKKEFAVAQQELQAVAMELENWRSKNFSFTGFRRSNGDDNLSWTVPSYTITINVSNNGSSWHATAVRQDDRNYNAVLTSRGVRCMTRDNIQADSTDCGENTEAW